MSQRFRPSLQSLEGRLLLTTIRWINPDGGFWNVAANWDLNRMPGPGDDVVMDLPDGGVVTFPSGTGEVQSVSSTQPFTLAGGTLLVHGPLDVTNSCHISGGTLQGATIASDTILQAMGTNAVLEDVTLDGNLDVADNSQVTLAGTWRNSGTINVTGGTLDLGGSFATADLGTILQSGGSVRITGTLDNTGAVLTLDGATGSWTLDGGTIQGGTVDTRGGARLLTQNSSNHLVGVTVSGDIALGYGNLTVSQGLVLNGSLTSGQGDLYFDGTQTLSGTATLVFTGSNFDHLEGRNGMVTLGPAVTAQVTTAVLINFVNQGTITLANSQSVLNLGFGGSDSWRNDGLITMMAGTLDLGSTFTWADLGQFQRGGGTINITGTLDNTGQTLGLDATTGSLGLNGGTIRNGVVTAQGGATLVPSGRGGTLDGVTLAANVDVSGNTSLTLTGSWTNRATLRLTNGVLNLGGTFTSAALGDFRRSGGTVYLTGTLDNTNRTLTLNATTGSWELKDSGKILGGTVSTTDGTSLLTVGYPTQLNGVTLNGSLDVTPGELDIVNGLTLNGVMTIGDASNGASAIFVGSQTLSGAGTVVFENSSFNNLQARNGVVTLGPNILVRGGSGSMTNFVNQGIVDLGAPTGQLALGGSSWQNHGLIILTAGTLSLGGTFRTADLGNLQRLGGTVQLTGTVMNQNSQLTFNDTTGPWVLAGATINGGTVTTTATVHLLTANGTGSIFSGVVLNGDLDLGNASLAISNGLTLNGTLTVGTEPTVSAHVVFSGTQTLDGTGSIMLGASSSNTLSASRGTATLGPNITLQGGAGQITGIVNQGTIRIATTTANLTLGNFSNRGTISLSAGTLVLSGNLQRSDLGNFQRTGGTLSLTGTWYNNNNELLLDDQFGSLRLDGGTIYSGSVRTAGSAALLLGARGGTLNGVALNTDVQIPNGTRLAFAGTWSNHGDLALNGGTLDLGGTFRLDALGHFQRTGGTVDLTGQLDNTNQVLILNAATGSWNLEGTIMGGIVVMTEGTRLVIPSGTTGTLNEVVVNGYVDVSAGRLYVLNGLTLNGVLAVGGATSGTGRVYFYGAQTLDGAGTVVLGNSTGNDIESSGPIVTFGPTITIQGGSGQIGDFLNRGTIVLSDPSATVTLTGYNWQNQGVLRITAGTLNLGGTFTDASLGDFRRSGGTVNLTGTLDNTNQTLTLNTATGSWNLAGGTIRGGTITTTGGATLTPTIQGGTLDGVTLNTGLAIGSNARLNLSGSWVNHGTLTQTGGTLNLGGTFTVSALGDFHRSGGTVYLIGTLANTDAQLLLDDATGPWIMEGGTIQGGTITTVGANYLEADANQNQLIGVTLNGNLNLVQSTVTVTNGLTLNGSITFSGGFLSSSLIFQGSQTLAGTGSVVLNTSTYNAVAGQNGILTLGSMITIRGGSGHISNFLNQGTIAVSAPDTELTLAGTWHNVGVLSVDLGALDLGGTFTLADVGTLNHLSGTLNLTGTLDNTDTTLTLNDSTGNWVLNGGTIDGGIVTLQGRARLLIGSAASRLNGVTFNGNLDVANTGITVTGGLTLNGTLTLGRDTQSGALLFQGTQTLDGAATVIFQGSGQGNALVVTTNGATLTLGPSVTVHGAAGALGESSSWRSGPNIGLVIEGTIKADVSGQSITLAAATIDNQGLLLAGNGGTLVLQRLAGTGGGITSEGTVLIDAGSSLTANAPYMQTDGTTSLNDATLTAPLVDIQGGLLTGSGIIIGNVQNAARLEVGSDGVPGALVIQGDYTQTVDGTLALKIGGTDQGTGYDYLSVSGTATLDGTLDLTVLDGFYVQAGETFTPLTSGQRQGEFAKIHGRHPEGQDVYFDPVYDDTSFTLIAVPYGHKGHRTQQPDSADRIHWPPAVAALRGLQEVTAVLTQTRSPVVARSVLSQACSMGFGTAGMQPVLWYQRVAYGSFRFSLTVRSVALAHAEALATASIAAVAPSLALRELGKPLCA